MAHSDMTVPSCLVIRLPDSAISLSSGSLLASDAFGISGSFKPRGAVGSRWLVSSTRSFLGGATHLGHMKPSRTAIRSLNQDISRRGSFLFSDALYSPNSFYVIRNSRPYRLASIISALSVVTTRSGPLLLIAVIGSFAAHGALGQPGSLSSFGVAHGRMVSAGCFVGSAHPAKPFFSAVPRVLLSL